MSESITVGMLLTFAGGFLDAYTYICRGHVFANAQTGNVVLLGINIANGRWSEAAFCLIPIISFIAGILFAEAIKRRFKHNQAVHWRQIVLAIELVVLIAVGFIPTGEYNASANVAVSFVCSLQVESFRKLKGNPYATTMCTGNLRSATEHLFRHSTEGERKFLTSSLQYYAVTVIFIVGAAVGGVISKLYSQKAIWVACIALALVLLLMMLKPIDGSEEK